MKFLTRLIILIVIFVSTAGAYTADDCICRCECAGQLAADDDCPSDLCSPFVACNTCSGFVVSRPVRLYEAVIVRNDMPVYYEPAVINGWPERLLKPPMA